MIFILLFLGSSTPVSSLLPDGYGINITGDGTVTKEITRSVGDYRIITIVHIMDATILSEYSFDSFQKLQTIFFPKRMISIGTYCFKACRSLAEISIPEGIIELTDNTFFMCNSLCSIYLPSTLERISTNGLFYQNWNLKKYYVNEKNPFFSTDQTNSYLMNKNHTILYRGPGSSNHIVPKSVKIIMPHYSYECVLKSISFEESTLEEISSYSFQTENLESLILPNTLKRLNSKFFGGSIGTLFVPDSVEYLPDDALDASIGTLKIGKHPKVFFVDTNGIIFNKAQTVIFFVPNTTNVINMSNTVTSISKNLILNQNIEEVNVIGTPKKYQTIDGIVYTDSGKTLYACPGGKKKAVVPDTCTKIDDKGFHNTLIEEVHLSDSITRMESQSFSNCYYLRANHSVPIRVGLYELEKPLSIL